MELLTHQEEDGKMLFKKTFEELVAQSINDLQMHTDITNVSIGGVVRTLLEIINKQVSEYYEVLEINQAMGFLSSAEGFFLDLIGDLLNTKRLEATPAEAKSVDKNQKFYVTKGFLGDYIPSLMIESGTVVSTVDESIVFTVKESVSFSSSAKEIYVDIEAVQPGSESNVGRNALISHTIDNENVYTVNTGAIVGGTDTEDDENYRFRISKATLSAEKANETAIRLAALSVSGVADAIMVPYMRGIGSYDVLVVPTEGIATESLLSEVQTAIEKVQAYGIKGYVKSPDIVPVDIEVKLIFQKDTTEEEVSGIKEETKLAIERFIVNIPVGGTFVLNELRQQVMNVSPKTRDHVINCYYFRGQPHIHFNVDIYDDEMFYPNPDSPEAIRVI
jgi:uncharacterized phage protein gp47/JayE